MNSRNKKYITIFIAILFTIITLNFPAINNRNDITKIKSNNYSKNEEFSKQEPFNVINPKTANSNPQQSFNFSFIATIKERWNETVVFFDVNSTKPNEVGTEWMNFTNTKGAELDFTFIQIKLKNCTDRAYLVPSNLTTMYLSYLNESLKTQRIGEFVSWPLPNPYNITGSLDGHIKVNKTSDVKFVIWNDWIENTNVSYIGYINYIANRTYSIETKFIPTPENTATDNDIKWELNYEGHNGDSNDLYNASIEIKELKTFTNIIILGYNGSYWYRMNYSKDDTHIFLNKPFKRYKIELETPNFVSIVNNANLTFATGKNELKLSATAGMNGNLTIRFLDTNGTLYEKTTKVVINQTVFFNYVMNLNATGGMGYLNVSLTNESSILFGIRIREVILYKQALLQGFTSNTTAFSQFIVAVGYIDINFLSSIYGKVSEDEALNLTMIQNATVTYELLDLKGNLEYKYFGVIPGAPKITVYWTIVNLSRYQIAPGTYNITFRGNKLGYSSLEWIVPIVIEKAQVQISTIISPENKIFTIEETFAITINLRVGGEPFVRNPVDISFTIYKDNVIDDHFQIPDVVQSYTIQGPMGNDSIPGNYLINISILSDYYNGSTTFEVEVVKKPLGITLAYDEDDFKDGKEFEVSWALENNAFVGNRENMTLEIYLDGIFHSEIDLDSGSSGITKFELDEGDYTLTYKLVSPFYTAETSVIIEVVKEKEPEPSWLDQNWIWLVIGIVLIIAFASFATFMVISRHKIKVKRGLESELIALKNRTSSTETAINTIESQIAQIVSIYWILVVHSEQGTTMVEIDKFYFEKVLGEDQLDLIGKGEFRDSALIGGFLTAIRSFSRETSGTPMASQPIFNSETDYSTVVDNMEIHRRILEGTNYFMAFVSTKPTSAISDTLTGINSLFEDNYGEAAKKFVGSVAEFIPFREEVPKFLREEIRKLQKEQKDQQMLLEHYGRHLNQVQDKIGIKPKKIN